METNAIQSLTETRDKLAHLRAEHLKEIAMYKQLKTEFNALKMQYVHVKRLSPEQLYTYYYHKT